jgi:MFS family permease
MAELMPARVRGRAMAIVMNFWPVGAVVAGLMAYLLLDTLNLASAVSWRYLFVTGGAIALVVLYSRRRIPESPRWLASRGRYAEAQRIVGALEGGAASDTQPTTAESQPAAPGVRAALDVRAAPGVRGALDELVRRYRGRLALGMLLDLAEAFGYTASSRCCQSWCCHASTLRPCRCPSSTSSATSERWPAAWP